MGYRSGAGEVCPACRAEVPVSAVETRGPTAQADCPACGFSWTFDTPDFAASATPGPIEPPVPPVGWALHEKDGEVVLTQPWLVGPALVHGLLSVALVG